jgi:hypothetical protein
LEELQIARKLELVRRPKNPTILVITSTPKELSYLFLRFLEYGGSVSLERSLEVLLGRLISPNLGLEFTVAVAYISDCL